MLRAHIVAPEWMVIVHVCCHWHNAAVNYPALCLFLYIGSKSKMNILLKRLKLSPLYIYFDYGRFWASSTACAAVHDVLLMALRHMDCVEELTILYSTETPEGILKRLTGPAPVLHSFWVHDQCQPHIHRNILDGVVPKLSQLYLADCNVDWISPIFSKHLTYLTLHNLSGYCPPEGTDEFSLLFEQIHRHWYNQLYRMDMQSTGQIKLPFLQELIFTSHLYFITMFFTFFKISSSTAIKLMVNVPQLNVCWNSIHLFIKTQFNSISGMLHDHLPLHSLVLCHYDGWLEEMCCIPEVKAQVADNLPGELQIQLFGYTSSNFYNILLVSDLEKLAISFVSDVPDVNPWTM